MHHRKHVNPAVAKRPLSVSHSTAFCTSLAPSSRILRILPTSSSPAPLTAPPAVLFDPTRPPRLKVKTTPSQRSPHLPAKNSRPIHAAAGFCAWHTRNIRWIYANTSTGHQRLAQPYIVKPYTSSGTASWKPPGQSTPRTSHLPLHPDLSVHIHFMAVTTTPRTAVGTTPAPQHGVSFAFLDMCSTPFRSPSPAHRTDSARRCSVPCTTDATTSRRGLYPPVFSSMRTIARAR